MSSSYEFCLCLGICAILMSGHVSPGQPATREIFRETISEGRAVVVTQEPMVPVSAVRDLLPPGVADRPVTPPIGFLSVTISLHFATNPPLRLWSQVGPIYGNWEISEYAVLDMAKLPDRLVFAMVYPGSTIAIAEVGLHRPIPMRMTSLRSADWSLLAAAIPAPAGRLGAKLTYNEKEKRIEVEVTDFLQDTKQHTLFEQKGEEWQFVRVKQWREKPPATNPYKN